MSALSWIKTFHALQPPGGREFKLLSTTRLPAEIPLGQVPHTDPKTREGEQRGGNFGSGLVTKEQHSLNLILKSSADLHETATQWDCGHMLKNRPRWLRVSGAPQKHSMHTMGFLSLFLSYFDHFNQSNSLNSMVAEDKHTNSQTRSSSRCIWQTPGAEACRTGIGSSKVGSCGLKQWRKTLVCEVNTKRLRFPCDIPKENIILNTTLCK